MVSFFLVRRGANLATKVVRPLNSLVLRYSFEVCRLESRLDWRCLRAVRAHHSPNLSLATRLCKNTDATLRYRVDTARKL